MTIHVTWVGVLAFIGVGALSLFVLRSLYSAWAVLLYIRGMRGPKEKRK